MSIEEKIREVASEGWPKFGFVLEDWAGVDRAVDKTDLPAIVCLLIENGELDFKNGYCRDSENVVLAFIDKVPMDADGDDNQTTFESMKGVMKEFISALMATHYFEPITEKIVYNSLYEALASNVSGVWCTITLKEAKGICL